MQKVNIEKIAKEGVKIYERLRKRYDPKEKGKFLAIDTKTQEVYLGNSSAEALVLARQKNPNAIFYIIKIGFDTAETVAKSYLQNDI